MTYHESAHQLEHDLSALPGVRFAALQWPAFGLLEVGVVVENDTLELRDRVIALIDDFHRAHVQELSVDFDIVDVEHAAHLFAHTT